MLIFNGLEGFILVLLLTFETRSEFFNLLKSIIFNILFKFMKAVPLETYKNAGK